MIEQLHQINSLFDPLRVVRIGPFSAFDAVGAYLGMLLATPLVNLLLGRWNRKISYLEMLALTLPLGFLAHLVFGFDTPFVQMFFEKGAYFSRLVVALMFIFGIKGFFRKFRP